MVLVLSWFSAHSGLSQVLMLVSVVLTTALLFASFPITGNYYCSEFIMSKFVLIAGIIGFHPEYVSVKLQKHLGKCICRKMQPVLTSCRFTIILLLTLPFPRRHNTKNVVSSKAHLLLNLIVCFDQKSLNE